jgi:general secretion pathway protein K
VIRFPGRRNSPSRRPSIRRQRGIALLTALFVVALATIAAVAMESSSAIAVRRTETLRDSERAWWYADGAESWVKSVLEESSKANKGEYDSLADPWAQPVTLPIDQGAITGQIVDLQGRFNLNNLAGAAAATGGTGSGTSAVTAATAGTTANGQQSLAAQQTLAQFQRLLDNIPGIDPATTQGLGQAIRDWIDSDDERSGPDGAEDGDYLGLDPPYRAANQLMHSVTELMAVRGMTADIYNRLLPYVCALPVTNAAININTAPLPVLMSLSTDVDGEQMQRLVEDRLKNPLKSTSDALKDYKIPSGVKIDVKSSYFEMQGQVVVGSARVALYSVIYRPPSTSGSTNAVPVVISHSTDTE